MDTQTAFDTKAFRNALGHFATGVTIITAADSPSRCVGVTVNSFSSVSLTPPLVLWSLNRNSGTLPVYEDSKYFIVNILAENQIELSNHFARPGVEDKFAGLDCPVGINAIPMIPGCAAWFHCRKRFTYEGGDHLIFIGEVEEFEATDNTALLYHQGQYAVSERHPATARENGEEEGGSFVQGYLDYLLTQTSNAFEKQFQEELDKRQVSRYEWRILSCLSEYGGVDYKELSTLTLVPLDELKAIVSGMQGKGWIREHVDDTDRSSLFVEAAGLDRLVPLMAVATAHEATVMMEFSSLERRRLKEMLRVMLRRINEPLFHVTETNNQGREEDAA